MGQLTLLIFTIIFCSTLSPSHSWAEDYATTVSGEGRVRWEYKNNTDYLNSADDKDDFVGSRFRLNINLEKENGIQLFIQPQATRTWGQKVFQSSGSTTAGGATVPTGSENTASGGLTDDQFTVHQSYLKYSLCEDTDLTLGRQELAYGDHLVLGNVGWSNVGRSFDALKTHTILGGHWVDFFWSEVVETSSNSTTDRSFAGLYTNWDITSGLKAFEVYVFYDKNEAATKNEQWTYGNRIAWANETTGAKLEYTGQSEDGFQADTTINHMFMDGGLDTGIGYFYANEDYDQLFPTAHKWMGTADFFSRRNIQGPRAFVKYAWGEGMSAAVTYHNFNRVSDKHSAYNFGGGAIGTGSEKGDHIADEIDLAFTYKKSANLTYQIGGSTVMLGDFIKNAKGVAVDDGEFLYMSVLVKL